MLLDLGLEAVNGNHAGFMQLIWYLPVVVGPGIDRGKTWVILQESIDHFFGQCIISSDAGVAYLKGENVAGAQRNTLSALLLQLILHVLLKHAWSARRCLICNV